jgi:nucleotide-binding universal stress UspA family protein
MPLGAAKSRGDGKANHRGTQDAVRLAMHHFRHILVPTDFEACSRRALAVAFDLAKDLPAKVTLFHAYFVPRFGYAAELINGEFAESLARGARRDLEKEARRGLAESTVSRSVMETALAAGPPSDAILAFAEGHGVDLIVVGTHGHGRFARSMLGSVSERVLRQSKIPVLLVPAPQLPLEPRDERAGEGP